MRKVAPKPRMNATAECEDFAGSLPLACAVLSMPWAAAPLFNRHSCPTCPESYARKWRGWTIPLPHVAGDIADPAPWGPSMSPAQGEQGLQDMSNWEHSLGFTCCRDSAGKQLLEEQHRPTHLSSTAVWGKECLLSCAASRQAASPLPCAQAPSGP